MTNLTSLGHFTLTTNYETIMKTKALLTWVYTYAIAVKELSWIGGIADRFERAEAKKYYMDVKNRAMKNIRRGLKELE